ncbi:MAG: CDP-glycerol glycerophosphotransferase family protein [Lachnospiraceae bacterium]|nr:CDP-glycerol glycerophosphotransferase family protein [Lachnospiraceae bacterium]
MNKDLLRVAFKPLTFVNRIIKKKDIIFFYSNLGFRDNVKAFYDYLIENEFNKKYSIVVSANDWKDFVSEAPDNVTFTDNKKGIFYFLKSKYAFYSFGKYPIKPSKDQIVVNLWHGMPLKKLGNMEKGLEKIDYNYFSYIISTSKLFNPILMKCFSCSESQVVITGQPRNDELFAVDSKSDESLRMGADKLIVWLPTYRDSEQVIPLPGFAESDVKILNGKLKEHGMRMIVKIHPFQKVVGDLADYECIEFLTQDDLKKRKCSVYGLLRAADALITDYSSVYFDYMLLDRPMAFTVGDLEKYDVDRGFTFENPYDMMPGPYFTEPAEVLTFVESIAENRDEFRDKRRKVNESVNYYKDGNSAKRIKEFVFGE